jgi:hypothetical protein
MPVILDPAGAAYAAIGAGNLRPYMQGADNAGYASLANLSPLALAARAAAHAPLDYPDSVAGLLDSLRAAGADEQAAALAARAAAHAPLDNPAGLARLIDSLRAAGAHE